MPAIVTPPLAERLAAAQPVVVIARDGDNIRMVCDGHATVTHVVRGTNRAFDLTACAAQYFPAGSVVRVPWPDGRLLEVLLPLPAEPAGEGGAP